ncbi:MAG: aminopeptidase [Deltaproteobacteria bacterium]|jgi:aspartyl aminopeptidase|nr:aminopeptidase [Deltaproteobacteria bacterium]
MAEKKKAVPKKVENNVEITEEESQKSIWDILSDKELLSVEETSLDYRNFLSANKTERVVASTILNWAAEAGLAEFEVSSNYARGGYMLHHGKLLGLYVPGRFSPSEGFNVVVVHGDAPRLDLKPKCLYEDLGLGLLKSNLYGGLKKFQWLTRPLALWGFCALKDGRSVEVRLGEDPGDPVLTVTDILPHLDRKVQRDKRLSEAFPAEKLNVLAASKPEGEFKKKNRLKSAILKILEDRWGLKQDDLISSELELVPAGPAREVGFDRSLIGGYAQDDRLNVYCAVKALLKVKHPYRPLLLIIFDREEIGSYGSTGAETNFIQRLVASSLDASGYEPRWLDVQTALANSWCLSADVEAAIDPTFKETHDELNAGKLGFGPCLTRYTGSAGKYGASEARAEYMAFIRQIFDKNSIVWQSSLLGKQEEGGGGTVALSLAAYGLSVVDCGAPVLSMHSPFEITSKADLWMMIKAIEVFFLSYGTLDQPKNTYGYYQ